MDADRVIKLFSIAVRFARVITHPPMNSWKWIVPNDDIPCFPKLPFGREGKPGLNVLACRACVVAWRHEVQILRPLHSNRSGASLVGQVWWRGEIGAIRIHKLLPGSASIQRVFRVRTRFKTCRDSPSWNEVYSFQHRPHPSISPVRSFMDVFRRASYGFSNPSKIRAGGNIKTLTHSNS